MPARYSRISGVDFSGAQQAGKGIWVADGLPSAGRLEIGLLTRLDWLPGSAKARTPALAYLRERIASRPDVLTGLDFPFSLPAMLLGGRSWQAFVCQTMPKYPDAETFRSDCFTRAGRREIRRTAEAEAKTPLAAYNLLIYHQTFQGMTQFIAPLVSGGQAAVLPMMDERAGKPAMIEICPASTLKAWQGNLGNVGYKKSSKRKSAKDRASQMARRRGIADELAARGVSINAASRDLAIEDPGGDALDALLAAYATWQAWLDPACLAPRAASTDALEGRVYF